MGLLSGCSNDDLAIVNESNVGFSNESSGGVLNQNNAEPMSNPASAVCADVNELGGSATLSSTTGPQILFTWNSDIDHDPNKTYVSYIELAEDAACPNPVWATTPVASTYPIDVFNTSSMVAPGVVAKCFQWRIVVNGYSGSTLECTTTTEWKGASYVQ